MQPPQTSLSDEAIWERAHNDTFIPPPQPWTFGNGEVKFGCDIYCVDKATLYELALLDVHSQYWETTSPGYLRRYHRGLQYNVEHSFRSINAISTYGTPPFLNSWLVRVIFMKLHDRRGREMVDYILNDVSKDERLKLETGDFQEEDWKVVINHKHHQAALSWMIQTICSERQISQNSNSGYAWSLPIFHTIKCETNNISTPLDNHPTVLLYKSEVMEQKWEGLLELSTSHVWMIEKTPFQNAEVKRLLDGEWLNDEVINAYLELCACLRSDIKFLPTQWFPGLATWGLDAKRKTVAWISKGAADVAAAMKTFAAVIVVINEPQCHWVVLQFDPKREVLEVLDSMAPKNNTGQMEKIRKMILLPLGLNTWHVEARKNTPQQKGASDCGVYACQFAKHLALETPFLQSFNKKQCEWIRKMMVVELADGRVRIPWR